MTATLTSLLLQLSESGRPPLLWGRQAKPYFGPSFDRLLAAGVLAECPPIEEWSACADCDCGFGIRPIQRIDGRIVAACPVDAGSDTELEEADTREFRIDPERLVSLIATASGFLEPLDMLAPSLWRIGRLASGRFIVVAVTAQVLDQAGIVLMLKAVAGGAAVTVVAPKPDPAIRMRFLEAGVDLVELQAALRPSEGAADQLDPPLLESKGAEPRTGAELVVRRGAGTIDWRGTTIGFTHQQFPVLLRLLEGARSHSKVASGPLVEDATGREAKDLIRELRQRVEGAGFSGAEAKSLIRAVHGRGYTLGVALGKIAIEE